MPAGVQAVARYLPFQFAAYFPIQIILNQLSPEAIQRGFALAILWLVVAFVAFQWVWREGVKRFSAVGA
jgi:ABC-2 type transport system permease protein